MRAFSTEIVGRLAVLAGVTVAALAMTATAASASGTLSVAITGAGDVGGSGIDCARGVDGKPQTGVCAVAVEDEVDCDPARKPPCFTIPASAAIAARGVAGFTFDRWAGACAGSDATCVVALPRSVSTTAIFRDAANPTVALGKPGAGPVAGTVPLEAAANDNAAVDRVEFRVRGVLVATDSSAPYQASFDTKSIADGAAGVTATAVDTSGLTATTTATNVFIDNTRPALSVAGSQGTFGPGTTQSWTLGAVDAGGTGIAQVRCSVVAAGAPANFAPCSGGNGAHAVTGRPEGAHVLTVRAVDAAGNATDVTRSFAIDATPPETTIVSGIGDGATTTDTSLTWSLEASEPGSVFECRVHPAALTPGAFAPCSAGASHTATGFAPGTYTFETRATDAVGNVESSTVKRTFTVAEASTAPTTPVTPVTPGSPGGPGSPAAPGPAAQPKAPAPQILVTLAFDYHHSTKTSTTLAFLTVKNVPAGSTVTATCAKGCAKKSFKKTGAKNKVSLAALLKKSLKVNTTIKVVVSKAGSSSAIKILKIRARKSPLVTTQCQPEGAAKPAKC